MSQVITATFENGVLRPDEQLALPAGTRVPLIVESLDASLEARDQAWQELEQLWEEASVDSGGVRFTRDQLHERR
jgi:predicted DNA-binding antitoxin AbrB/MazE fold protein